MDPRLYWHEPFPSYYEVPPNPQFKSVWSGYPLMSSPSAPSNRNRHADSLQALFSRITTNLHLRYYQYEVTLGLYIMDPIEKRVLNVCFLLIVAMLVWTICSGIGPFVAHTFCRALYYATGGVGGGGKLCYDAVDAFKKLSAKDMIEATGIGNVTVGPATAFAR